MRTHAPLLPTFLTCAPDEDGQAATRPNDAWRLARTPKEGSSEEKENVPAKGCNQAAIPARE